VRTIGEIEYCDVKTNLVVVNVPVYGRVECITDESENVFNTLVKSEGVSYGVIEILECEAYFLRFLDTKDVRLAVKNNDCMNICDFCNRNCLMHSKCNGFEWNGLFDLNEGIKGYC
jgi:hypothetical protein